MSSLLLLNLIVLMVVFSAIWVVSVALRNASIIDLFWGGAFVTVAWVSAVANGQFDVQTTVILTMVTAWGLRLSWYLVGRNWGKPEDFRYAAMRERRGSRFPIISLVTVFWLQAVLAWIISLPVQAAISDPDVTGWTPWFLMGILVFLIGLLFESIGDAQMARFKADPGNSGKVMDRGLWRFTRHPNYFGEFLVWWGVFLVAADWETWWWTIIGPLLLSFLLLRVSGVTMLEDSLRDRLSGYEEYINSTSSFIPLPPRGR